MIIDLVTLESPHKIFDLTLPPEEVALDDESAALKSPVHVAAELRKGSVQTDLTGTIAADVTLECTRCLARAERRLEFPFAAAFVAPEYYTEAREAELNAADLDVSIVEDNRLDLTAIVREQILLNLPEQVFCGDDCRGLCARCGANLNETACRCEEEEIDPRWAGLKNLK